MSEPSTARRIAQEPGRKPRLCISRCLLGDEVRYDGAGKLDERLLATFADSVEWVPVCPEVECGMPVPRPRMHLADDPLCPRMVTTETGEDQTGRMAAWVRSRMDELEHEELSGFILKSRSPSCGPGKVPVLGPDGGQVGEGLGIFSAAVAERFPDLPLADEKGLLDADALTDFVDKLIAEKRRRHAGETG